MDIRQVTEFMVTSIMKHEKTVNEKISEKLETEFETQTQELESKRKRTEIQVNASDSEKDYWLVRKNMKELISTGEDAVEGILKVALEGDSPRAYEVAAQMIKTVAETNKDLVDLHQKMKNINKEEINVHNTTNNSLYIGSTSDLQNLINDARSTDRNQKQNIIDAKVIENDD